MNDLPQTSAPETADGLPHLSGNAEGTAPMPAPSEAAPAARHGQFRILRPHARGGLGQVSLAMDESLGRTVAVKEIRADIAQNAHTRRRFVQEAEVTGQLEHPNIVPIYALGQDEHGRPYYAMRFVDGQTLEQLIAAYHAAPTPLVFQDLLRRFVAVCQAMAYAHSQGIIHRDLKPANIMTGRYGETLILDWGLAKRLNGKSAQKPEHEPSGHALELPALSGGGETLAGHAIGTPAYMPPEQAHSASESPSTSADVYALGAILYQTLTGRPPHQGESRTAVISRAAIGEVARPSSVGKKVPKALEAVCLKAMARKPEDRYASAAELAQEVERFLADEPVAAYRQPLFTKAARWARRHKPAVAAAAALLVTAVVALVISNVFVARQRNAKTTALAAERIARTEASQNLHLARANEQIAQQRLFDGLLGSGRGHVALKRFSHARRDYSAARKLATELGISELPATAGWATTLVHSSPPLMGSDQPLGGIGGFHGHSGGVVAVAFSPDGRTAVSGGLDQTLKLWEVRTGRALGTLRGHTGAVWAVVFSADGKTILSSSADTGVRLWDVATKQQIREFIGHTEPVDCVAFSPDGRTALSGGWPGTMKHWDLATGREMRTFEGHSRGLRSVSFLPDGQHALTASFDNTLKLWDLSTGEQIRTFAGHQGAVHGAAVVPDGSAALSASWDGSLKLWDLKNGTELRTFNGHEGPLRHVAISSDGKQALSCGDDGLVKLWDIATGSEIRTFAGHGDSAVCVAFSPDGNSGLSASADGTIKLWDLTQGADVKVGSGHQNFIISLAMSPNGLSAASAAADGAVKLWDVATGRELRTLHRQSGYAWDVAFSPDGQSLITAGDDKVIRLIDVTSGEELRRFSGHTDAVLTTDFSPDGRSVVSGGRDRTVRLWDAATGSEVRKLIGHTDLVRSVTFSRGGRRVLSGGFDNMLRVWDVIDRDRAHPLHAIEAHTAWVLNWTTSVAVSPDGRYALSGGCDNLIKLWDLQQGVEVRTFRGHSGWIWEVAFSADGRTAVSASTDQTVRLWDVSTGNEIARLNGHTEEARGVVILPDGQTVISCGSDRTIRIWELDRHARYGAFEERLPPAREAMDRNPDDPEALFRFGEWYAFRGVDAWAVEFLEQARAGGADISPLMLARCYWNLDRHDDARREFQLALERGEAPAEYLQLCIAAANSTDASATLSAGEIAQGAGSSAVGAKR